MKVPKFLRCLYEILQNEDPRILAWSVDGSCFQVYDLHRLENEVLPKYFKHNKFTSFQRQLNNFGFRKWTKTRANVCTFSHDDLVRCHPAQLSDMLQATGVSFGTSASGKRCRSTSMTDSEISEASTVDLDLDLDLNGFEDDLVLDVGDLAMDLDDGFESLLTLKDVTTKKQKTMEMTAHWDALGWSVSAEGLGDTTPLQMEEWELNVLTECLCD